MSEKIIVRQDNQYRIEFEAVDPNQPDAEDFRPVQGLHEITPYGMMLASLATCTAQVVLSYANHHGLDLEEVEFRVAYDRSYQDDCDDCENIDDFDDIITEEIRFRGNLSEKEREKLFKIAHQCPIEKIFREGIKIQSELKQS